MASGRDDWLVYTVKRQVQAAIRAQGHPREGYQVRRVKQRVQPGQ